MKILAIAALSMVICVIEAQKYTDKYDRLVLDDILTNRKLLNTYIKCVMDQGRCTPDGKELKSHITEALQNGCKRCTDAQRVGIRKVITHLRDNEEESWRELTKKYDPKRIYAAKYDRQLKALYGR